MRGTAYEGYTYYECSKNLGEANWEEAKRMAKNHRGGGYDDWYLPNKTELNNIYENLAEKGFIEATGKFWSSSESNPSTAWCQFFINGFQDDFQLKSGHIDVRAIRVFYD